MRSRNFNQGMHKDQTRSEMFRYTYQENSICWDELNLYIMLQCAEIVNNSELYMNSALRFYRL